MGSTYNSSEGASLNVLSSRFLWHHGSQLGLLSLFGTGWQSDFFTFKLMPLSYVYAWAFPLIAGGAIVRYLVRTFILPVLWSPIANIPGPITASFWGSNIVPLFECAPAYYLRKTHGLSLSTTSLVRNARGPFMNALSSSMEELYACLAWQR